MRLGRLGRMGYSWLFALALLGPAVATPSAAPAASSGQLYAFGDNYYGQLGNATNNGTDNPDPTPTLVSLPGASGSVTRIAAGHLHTLALTSAGQLYSFGWNQYGQLGNATNSGTNNPNPTPALVSLPGQSGQVTQIAAGTSHTLALTSAGQLYSFGRNQFGQLGTTTNSGTNNPNPTPTLVSLPAQSGQITQIAAGNYDSFALTSTGQLYAFGNNYFGQLGTTTSNSTNNPNPTPALVGLPAQSGQVTQLAAGADHTLALTSTGQVYAFGWNRYGQLGDATNNGTDNPNPTPALVTLPGGSSAVAQLAAGDSHSLALTSTGQLYAFGFNYDGELGNATNNGTTNPNPTPALVTLPGQSGQATQISAGSFHSLALTSSGRLFAFGYNRYGQLGNGNSGNSPNPTPSPVTLTVPVGMQIDALSRGPGAIHTLVAIGPIAPALTALLVSPRKRSSAGRLVHGHCVKPTKKNRSHKHCTRKTRLSVSYTLNTVATATLTLTRQTTGRKVKGRCIKLTHHNRKRRHCKLSQRLGGAITHASTAGSNSLVFARKLTPGNYRLTIIATANGHTSSPQSASIKITR